MDTARGDAPPAPREATRREIEPIAVQDLIERIGPGRGLSTIKLNHGFWERLVRLEDGLGIGPEGTLADAEEGELIAALERQRAPWPAALLSSLLALIRSRADAPGLMILASPFGWRGAYEVEGTPLVGLDRVCAAIDRYVPAGVPVFDGLVWKDAIEDGSFAGFVEELRARPVLIAAPEYARGFAAHAGLKDAAFVAVHPTRAAWEVSETLERIGGAIERLERPPVTLIESGGVASSWLCAKLGERLPGTVNLSLGQALNLFAVEQIRRTNWFWVRGERILATARAIDPGFDLLWETASGASESSGAFRRPCSAGGRDLALGRLTSQAIAIPAASDPRIAFVERKEIDHELVAQLLGLSERARRFANFGPVSRLLEAAVHELLGLSPAGEDRISGEPISFHHTKPWGMGEGGCIVLEERDAATARSLLNFGVGLDWAGARRHARNSKYSDYDSALVLQRLVSLPRWADLYRMQARRVGSIAARAGLEPLAPVPDGVILGSLALLASAEIADRQLANPHLALRKYYRPLAEGAPRAADIYRRIVNVPCHPGVAECPTEALEELALGLRDGG